MKYLKLFEDFNSRNPKQVAELLEDLFVEIFDKWEIKEIPDGIEDGQFFASLDTEDLYYNIRTIELGKGARIIFKIQQNIFQPSSIERFKEMVRDCQPVLNRLKSFGVDFEWDSQMMQNPFDFGRLEYFRVIVTLNNINESMEEESLLQQIDEEQYRSWEKRIIGQPEEKIIPIIREEIGKIEKKIGNRSFDDEFEFFGYVYEYHRKFSLSDNKSDLYVTVGKCDDDWYLIEIYSEWYYSWYLADTEEGLKELASKFQ